MKSTTALIPFQRPFERSRYSKQTMRLPLRSTSAPLPVPRLWRAAMRYRVHAQDPFPRVHGAGSGPGQPVIDDSDQFSGVRPDAADTHGARPADAMFEYLKILIHIEKKRSFLLRSESVEARDGVAAAELARAALDTSAHSSRHGACEMRPLFENGPAA